MIKHTESFVIKDPHATLMQKMWQKPFTVLGFESLTFALRTNIDANARKNYPCFYVEVKANDKGTCTIEGLKTRCRFTAAQIPTPELDLVLLVGGDGKGPNRQWLKWSDFEDLKKLEVKLDMCIYAALYSAPRTEQLASDYKAAFEEGKGDVKIDFASPCPSMYAHSQILSIRCPVMKTMLQGPFSETKNKSIDMSAFSSKLALGLVRYLYVGDLACFETKTLQEAVDLFKLADYYQVPNIMEESINRIVKMVPDNINNQIGLRALFELARTIAPSYPDFADRLRQAMSGFGAQLFQFIMQT